MNTQPAQLRPSSALKTAGQLCAELEAIDRDLKTRVYALEQAGKDYFSFKRDIELEEAKAFMQAEGTDSQRKAKAKVFLEGMALYNNFKKAEGDWNGLRAAVGAIETRASVNQSLLRRQDQ